MMPSSVKQERTVKAVYDPEISQPEHHLLKMEAHQIDKKLWLSISSEIIICNLTISEATSQSALRLFGFCCWVSIPLVHRLPPSHLFGLPILLPGHNQPPPSAPTSSYKPPFEDLHTYHMARAVIVSRSWIQLFFLPAQPHIYMDSLWETAIEEKSTSSAHKTSEPSGLAPWPPGEVGSTCDLQSLEQTWYHLWKEDKGLMLSPGHRGEMRGDTVARSDLQELAAAANYGNMSIKGLVGIHSRYAAHYAATADPLGRGLLVIGESPHPNG
ncbi:hypothetical protein EMCRGX_G020711 [Ephydatia muelleri]